MYNLRSIIQKILDPLQYDDVCQNFVTCVEDVDVKLYQTLSYSLGKLYYIISY